MLLTAGKPTAKGWKGDLVNFYTNSVRHIQSKPIKFLYCRWCQLVTGRSFLWHLRPVTTVVFLDLRLLSQWHRTSNMENILTLLQFPSGCKFIHFLLPTVRRRWWISLIHLTVLVFHGGKEFFQCLANVLVWKKNSAYHSYYSYIVASVRYLI